MTRITRRGVAASAAATLVTVLSMPGDATGQAANRVATPGKPAVLPLAARRGTGTTFLDLWVKAYTPPRRGQVEAVVSLVADGVDAIEIGRFAVFPSQPFLATNAAQQRAYRFDATAALAALPKGAGRLAVVVGLVPIDEKIAPERAQLTLSKAEFSPPPKD